jgi:hypothetical protein
VRTACATFFDAGTTTLGTRIHSVCPGVVEVLHVVYTEGV